MTNLEKSLNEKLAAALTPAFLKVTDTSNGCGSNFNCIVVTDKFENVNRLNRQRLVNGAVKEEMTQIHAFTMQCFDPKEWETKKTELGFE